MVTLVRATRGPTPPLAPLPHLAVASLKTYISARRAFLQTQLATVAAPFAVDGPPIFSTANNLVVLTGTAPVGVKNITLNGVVYPVTWTSATGFVMRIGSRISSRPRGAGCCS